MGILCISADARTRTAITAALQELSPIEFAPTIAEGFQRFTTIGSEMVIFDLLPGTENFAAAVTTFRQCDQSVRLVVITTPKMVEERVRALESGIDDDLIKPFAGEELLARIRLQFRAARSRTLVKRIIGDIEIDAPKRLVKRAGRIIDLTDREYRLLNYFFQRRGEMIDRVELKAHLYASSQGLKSNAIDSAICSLRKKLDTPGEPEVIQTRRGMGYIFMPEWLTGEKVLTDSVGGEKP